LLKNCGGADDGDDARSQTGAKRSATTIVKRAGAHVAVLRLGGVVQAELRLERVGVAAIHLDLERELHVLRAVVGDGLAFEVVLLPLAVHPKLRVFRGGARDLPRVRPHPRHGVGVAEKRQEEPLEVAVDACCSEPRKQLARACVQINLYDPLIDPTLSLAG
jgi:hypothetical protein